MQLFQFSGDQQHTFISKLSGGEKKRLQLLSILFSNPNFLILDEPTNDLDLVTLAVLEDFLQQYQGCVIIVSHDRYFMDKLVDHLFVFEGDGVITDFPGNYTEWRRAAIKQQRQASADKAEAQKPKPEPAAPKKEIQKAEPATNKRKLTFKEKTELEKLSQELPNLEKEKAELNEKLISGQLQYAEMNKLIERFGEVSKQLEEKELRWLELSELAGEE